MRRRKYIGLAASAALLLAAGCQQNKVQAKQVDTAPFKTALADWYQAHPVCAWQSPKTFPVDLDGRKPNPVEEQQLDAFVDAGLLSKKRTDKRTEDAHHRRHYERVIEYQLTDKGKAALTADSSQPNAGNFCIGKATVTSFDQYSQDGRNERYSVSYHFEVNNPAGWASNSKVKAAFPNLATEATRDKLAALATVAKTGSGWQASGIQPIAVAPAPQ